MKVKILDYMDRPTTVEIQKFEKVLSMEIIVISGDERLCVDYDDGTTEVFDSSKNRILKYFDGRYVVYNKSTNLLIDKKWLNRRNSYVFAWHEED